MEAAKAAVEKFTSHTGHHTEVDENINSAVTSEAVKPHRHEETTQAVDRETHQHHYHTTVQPISHSETLPEKHTHRALPVEHREFHHDHDHEGDKAKVAAEIGAIKHNSVTHETKHTTATAPAVAGEHTHHHVHETVIPVIHKETIQPEVVHTTQPIHETHHVSSHHHPMSALPMMSLDQFKSSGGVLEGSKTRTHEEYEGQPRPYNDKLHTTLDKVLHPMSHGSSDNTRPDSGVGGVGPHGSVRNRDQPNIAAHTEGNANGMN